MEARERLQKLQCEEDDEKRNKAIRDRVEAEMKKIDESGSSTSNNKEKSEAKKDPYDYFLKKEKAEQESESESDFSKTSVVLEDAQKMGTFKVHNETNS